MSGIRLRVNARSKKENVKIGQKTQKAAQVEGRQGYKPNRTI